LRLPEKKEYEEKLKKIERVNQLRMQRDSDSSHNRRINLTSHSNSLTPTSSRQFAVVSSHQCLGSLTTANRREELRTSSANHNKSLLEGNEPCQASKLDLNSADFSYRDPVGPSPQRPKTGLNEASDPFDMHDIMAGELLPE
jgi:hypothetical protein